MSETTATAAENLKRKSFKVLQNSKIQSGRGSSETSVITDSFASSPLKRVLFQQPMIPTRAGVATADHEKCTGLTPKVHYKGTKHKNKI